MTDEKQQQGLDFDKATYDAPSPSATPCSSCGAPLQGQYWRIGPRVLCERCQGAVAAKFAEAKTPGAFGKAVVLGTVVALGCGVGYAVFVGATHMQLALVTIGIAYVVAGVVRQASGGFGGRRFQVLAVALTYVASTMGYAPGMIPALKENPAGALPLVGIMLAAPFLELTTAPLGALIVGFGLWEAWRRSRGVPLALEGPFRVGG